MDDDPPLPITSPSLSVSPYLLRPLRTYEQALADIARAGRPPVPVAPFAPLVLVERTRRDKKPDIAA